MNMSNEIFINVILVDRAYRIKTDPANEEFIRNMCSQINVKVQEYKNTYKSKDIQDYLSMVILWFLYEQNFKTDAGFSLNNETSDELSEKLLSIEEIIDKQLENE